MTEDKRSKILRHFRPVHLGTSIILYFLGSGLVRYLGESLDFTVLFIGLAWMISVQLGFYFLGDHFHSPFDTGLFSNLPARSISKEITKPDAPSSLIFGSVSLLSAGAVLGVILAVQGRLNTASMIVMLFDFLLYILIVVPGISLDLSSVGEIISSIILVVIPPALAFFLQTGDVHRLLPLGVFPLFPLHLAMILVLRLKRYSDDLKQKRTTLLVRLGWVQGVFIHNLMVLSGFFLFGVSLLFDMPIRIIGSVFIAIPAGIILIWYLTKLEDGAPVRWPLITLLSLVVFFLPAYLVTYSIWIR